MECFQSGQIDIMYTIMLLLGLAGGIIIGAILSDKIQKQDKKP